MGRNDYWAVYGVAIYYRSPSDVGIGKIIGNPTKKDLMRIKYSESQLYPPDVWDSKFVRFFNSPIKAIAYSLIFQKKINRNFKNISKKHFKNRTILSLLERFPSERENIEKYLSPS